jgi:hypothetical protein
MIGAAVGNSAVASAFANVADESAKRPAVAIVKIRIFFFLKFL